MGTHTIHMDLSVKSVRNAIKELKKYEDDLTYKCQLLAEKLADRGIETAKMNTGNFGHYIKFSKEITSNENECTVIIVAEDVRKIISQWKSGDQIKKAEVSPLLMVEFGSGFKAQNPNNLPGVGQGTFPGQTHAFDKEGWYWIDLDGNLNHSYGITPKMPMYHAAMKMRNDIKTIAKEVFGNGK